MSDLTERNCDKCIHHTSGNCDSWDCKMQTVEDAKKEAVNEYVKLVVEELKKEAERWEDSGKEYKDKCEIAVARGLRNAIEIVKHGGVSDDVCEWKTEHIVVGMRRHMPNCCDKGLDMPVSTASGLKYCPYRGKKIKVVE